MGSVVYQNKNNHKENFSNYDTMFYEFRNYNASDVDVYFPSGAEYDSFISALNNEYSKTNDAKLVPYINAFPAWYQKSVNRDRKSAKRKSDYVLVCVKKIKFAPRVAGLQGALTRPGRRL